MKNRTTDKGSDLSDAIEAVVEQSRLIGATVLPEMTVTIVYPGLTLEAARDRAHRDLAAISAALDYLATPTAPFGVAHRGDHCVVEQRYVRRAQAEGAT